MDKWDKISHTKYTFFRLAQASHLYENVFKVVCLQILVMIIFPREDQRSAVINWPTRLCVDRKGRPGQFIGSFNRLWL